MSPRAKHLTTVFFESAGKSPENVAVRFCGKTQDGGTQIWSSWSWQAYASEVRAVAGWLRAKGIQKGDRVAILSANRPEWMVADLAILALGAISVPIYATSSAQDIAYILQHSASKALFIDDRMRIKHVSDHVPSVLCVFGEDGLQNLKREGHQPIVTPEAMDDDDLATIIYTSGTTGQPKGVMHSHGGLAHAAVSAVQALSEGKTGPDRFFSFLPLSHVAERLLVEICSIATASEVVFARGVETLIDDLKVYPPTILLCVPRLWERVHERIKTTLKTANPLKRAVFSTALRAGSVRLVEDRIIKTRDAELAARLSDLAVGRNLRKSLGMDRIRVFLTGSAPTHPNILKFFGSLGIFIREVYGLTENMCLGVYTPPDQIVIGSCGKPFPMNEVKIAADGEVLFRAPFNFKGYYKNQEATDAALLTDGWMATGDLGQIDNEGRLRITGRKKELLKTSTGKYVAPVPIEDELKKNPFIGDAMVVGDNQKYCIALVTVDPSHASPKGVEADLKEALESLNKSLANHESIKRVGILKTGFSVEDGTLTPTLKLKRKAASDKYLGFISRVYASTGMIIKE